MTGDMEWDQWRRAAFGDPYLVWHDGPDFTAVLDLARSDPATVTRMLRAGLAERDELAAQAFGALAAAGLAPADAASMLRSAMAEATDGFLLRLAEALFAVTGDPSWAGPIVSVLRAARSEFTRLAAAMALAAFPPAGPLVEALAGAVQDPEYLVRYHAANTLLRYAGDARELSDRADLFDKIATPRAGNPTNADREAWQAAAAELTARVRR